MKTKILSLSLALCTIAPLAWSQEVAIDTKINEINDRYVKEWEQINKEGSAISDDAPKGPEVGVGIDIDCQDKTQHIKLDIPEVAMKLNKMKLDLPQVSMKTKKLVWDNPETRMETTTCGYIPQFHGLKMRMKAIKCDLPRVKMVRREAKTDIPEMKWTTTEIKMDIPIFTSKTKDLSFKFPECKVKEIGVVKKQLAERSANVESRALALADKQKTEINAAVAGDLIQKRQDIDSSFSAAIGNITVAIETVQSYGINPTQVRQEDSSVTNLVAQHQDLVSRRSAELAKLDKLIEDFGK